MPEAWCDREGAQAVLDFPIRLPMWIIELAVKNEARKVIEDLKNGAVLVHGFFFFYSCGRIGESQI